MQVNSYIRSLNKGDLNFTNLDQSERVIAEYIWIGGSGLDIRSKSKILNSNKISNISQIPLWNYDGSSTNQASGQDSQIWLHPRAFYKDPFRGGNNILVLCDTTNPDGSPARASFRSYAKQILDLCDREAPWFGMEQEYTLMNTNTYPQWPLGFLKGGFPIGQGPYYCSNGANFVYGRQVMEAHLKCCLYCQLTISGTNAEVMPGQWEYQIGPVEGIKGGDQLWLSRYLLLKCAENFGVGVTFDCKPVPDWNGAGLHCNFSTNSTRAEKGMGVIYGYMEHFKEKHSEVIDVSGKGNQDRLSGRYETSSYKEFSWGLANRGCSIRIPRITELEGKGYLEDRRPASNCDPYVVTSVIADIAINKGINIGEIHAKYLEFVNSQ